MGHRPVPAHRAGAGRGPAREQHGQVRQRDRGRSIPGRSRVEEPASLADDAFLRRSRGFLHEPGIAVWRDAQIALQAGHVHAMHDPTEGGLATGTHVHVARRYNGEWISADTDIPFVLGGWVSAGDGEEYSGTLTKDGAVVYSWNGRVDENQISH